MKKWENKYNNFMVAKIDSKKCIKCGSCSNVCPCEAINVDTQGSYKVDETKCLGCGVCCNSCPTQAIKNK